METVYVISILLSIFCHCMGIFYTPIEASTDSCVFIIVVVMFLHKLKLMSGLMWPQNAQAQILEAVTLCLALQVLLIAIWFPVYQALQFLVDSACNPLRNDGQSLVVCKIQEYAATVGILAMELAVLGKAFDIDDLQRFFGSKDDLVSDSILTIVAQQQRTVLRREKLLRRR